MFMPNKHVRFYSNAGSRFEPIYSAAYDENGTLELTQVGEKNLYNEIQSHAESCDINLLISRFMAGEVDVFERVKGFYADVTSLPKTYQEFLNLGIKTENFFNSLPVEVKKEFNNSYTEFLVASTKPDFEKYFIKPKEVPSSQEPVKESDTDE